MAGNDYKFLTVLSVIGVFASWSAQRCNVNNAIKIHFETILLNLKHNATQTQIIKPNPHHLYISK